MVVDFPLTLTLKKTNSSLSGSIFGRNILSTSRHTNAEAMCDLVVNLCCLTRTCKREKVDFSLLLS